MKIVHYIPLLLAVLIYGVATYFILDLYIAIDNGISLKETFYLPLTLNVAGFLYISGSILVIGYFLSEAIKSK